MTLHQAQGLLQDLNILVTNNSNEVQIQTLLKQIKVF